MSVRVHRSMAAAERAKNLIERDVPQARVEIAEDLSLVVWCYEEVLSPSQIEAISSHDVRRPTAPSPATPLLPPSRPKPKRDKWARSTAERPAEICMSIFAKYHAEGRIDERTSAILECEAAGVNHNTAKTYYSRFRIREGLPKSVLAVRRKLRGRSPVTLSGKRPEGFKVANGITQPATGSRAREVWDMCDVLERKLARPPKLKEVRDRLSSSSKETVASAYKRWRRFHNIPPQRKKV